MMLEVCVENVKSAVSAWNGGAKRLELCSCLCLGGLTPSVGLFDAVRRSVPAECTIFVMIRAHQCESFVYDESDVEVMVEDIKIFIERGADGFVFGCLSEDREIDEKNCRKLLEAAKGWPCTFHRAFDVAKNPMKSLATLSQLGFSRILTSGQEKNAFLGRFLIEKLVCGTKELGGNVKIVAGGGVSVENLGEILEVTKVEEFHGSARGKGQSNGVYVTDQSIVHEMVEIGERLMKGNQCKDFH